MAENSILLGALERHAGADPESPFLFWPEGWNWRWWSWRQVAELAARWSAPLAGLRAGAGVAFAGGAYPQAIALDLAVQAAGLTPVPLPVPVSLPLAGGAGAAGAPGLEVDAEAVRREAVQAGCIAWLEAAADQVAVTRLAQAAGRDAAAGEDEAGGPGVLVAGDGGERRRLAEAELLAAAGRIDEAMGAPAGGRPGSRNREILVAGWPLQEWTGRLLAAWAILAGAALVLETDPARRLGTVLWARPTVFIGSAAEVAALRARVAAARRPRRWRGRRRLPAPPLGRLRILLQLEPPAPGEAAFWHERGARLVRLPGPGDDCQAGGAAAPLG
ncbi:MAG: hypothetical protein JOZ15_00050 [Acidobacteria bacterium]|nr:hypothetical protein [Acidobacteriota bacterium]